ncbi:hypothetical protein [Thermoleptolyngbya sp. C42_A2020_037]|uniref:hypothetical protein n=1 Tax=Thermoleptolyngbya sp. C42_A2020_037 TaxID=2747799 RepID=UPI0019DDF1DD|nr:hypothetical protein [Thermoleptolyngbya sp. C42_A2020_037]MBF2085332.1 hypothetical protein [Thermoleptolyngbya sp. C42_A2020_037]
MASDSTRPCFSAFRSQAELELLQVVLDDADASYPWNPADPAASSYFEQLEQEVAAGWPTDMLDSYAQSLSTQFDQLWATVDSAQDAAQPVLTTASFGGLFQRFADRMPQGLLERLVQQAQMAIASSNSLADQLVASVRDVLPEWGDDDLYVLARPFAYAMRDQGETDLLEGALRSVRSEAWEDLSSIEQARLSLAIARHIIDQSKA